MDCPGAFNGIETLKESSTGDNVPVMCNILSTQVANLLNVSPRKLAQHESLVAELLSDGAEVNLPSSMGLAQAAGNLESPVRLPIVGASANWASTNKTPIATPLTPPVTPKSQVKRPVDKNIATLVFFDLETTGLAHQIGKANVQITELSMIAMGRTEFQESTSNELKDIRIMHKLCLCLKPRTMISPGAAKVTGLDNYNLINEQPFNQNAATSVISFLLHLPKPVCLLAHNGIPYDFPILKSELKRHSIHLPSDIFIADTLQAIRALGVPVFPPSKKICKSVKIKNGQVSYALANLHLYFFNKKPTGSHSSEGDCIALAKVCHVMKDSILPWFDENCTIMDTVAPMW